MKIFHGFFIVVLVVTVTGISDTYAQGMFGLPQGYSRDGKGLYTGFGYLSLRDKYKKDRVMTQEMIYSEAGYGVGAGLEFYGRIGFVTNGALSRSLGSDPACASLSDLHMDDRFVGTIGARWFHAVTDYFGWGLFAQGSYYFNNASDNVWGSRSGGLPTPIEVKINNQWETNFGLGFQVTMPKKIKLYFGPCVHIAEGDLSSSPFVGQMGDKLKTGAIAGGYGGMALPLFGRFSLTAEGWYGKKFSAGTVVTYSY